MECKRFYKFFNIYNSLSNIELHWTTESRIYNHSHDFWEIFIIYDGKVVHTINDQNFILQKYDLVCIKPMDEHEFSPCAEGNSTCKYLNISIADDYFRETLKVYGMTEDDLLKQSKVGRSIVLSSFDFLSIDNIVSKITLCKNIDLAKEKKFQIVLLFELFKIFTCLDNDNTNFPQWLVDLVNYMNNPDTINGRAKDVYQLSGYGTTACLAKFKEYMGVSIVEYYTNSKIQHSCGLLIYTDLTTLSIASQIGFDSLSHYNHVFLKKFGISPGAYRKMNREVNNRKNK